VISGLTPALLISVEPSGIGPPFNMNFEFVPMDESGKAVPVDVALAVDALVDAQAEVMVELNPPPSKTEPATDPLVLQFETGAGLNPPGSISVAPSGMPVAPFDPLAALDPNPSGDVAPMPAVVIALCA
jgi:hypothetical protein